MNEIQNICVLFSLMTCRSKLYPINFNLWNRRVEYSPFFELIHSFQQNIDVVSILLLMCITYSLIIVSNAISNFQYSNCTIIVIIDNFFYFLPSLTQYSMVAFNLVLKLVIFVFKYLICLIYSRILIQFWLSIVNH